MDATGDSLIFQLAKNEIVDEEVLLVDENEGVVKTEHKPSQYDKESR